MISATNFHPELTVLTFIDVTAQIALDNTVKKRSMFDLISQSITKDIHVDII